MDWNIINNIGIDNQPKPYPYDYLRSELIGRVSKMNEEKTLVIMRAKNGYVTFESSRFIKPIFVASDARELADVIVKHFESDES